MGRIVWPTIGGWRMEADLSYYERRSAEERAAASAAIDAHAREVHLELAQRYDEQVTRLGVEVRRSELRLVSAA